MYTEKDKKFKRYTVTSALPYANGPVHIGHLAGVYVPADIYARYLRSQGEDVVFIGGSDEHGVPITIKARKEGVTPQDIVDRYHNIIKDSMKEFGVTFDIYSRTSSPEHAETASAYFKKLYEQGKFVEKVSQQLYDEEAHQFLADRYVTGTCPKCGNEHAYGDQCEACGTSLNATDLINPKSALSGSKPVLKETKHWFLPLDQDEQWLREWILEQHKDWKVNVYGQCKSWIDSGLQPRAVTRDLDWGVKVPVEGADGKVLYVWFDAPIGYISFTKQLKGDDWEKWWKDEETKLVHFIGKDNIVFHCIIFPSMLKADGSYIMPENVPANEFLNLEGDKISTSRNWAVWLHEYLKDFPGKQDVLRYTLCSNAPETKDNDFSWKDFQLKNNSELVAILGNFVNRTLVLSHKFFGGKVPTLGALTDLDNEVLAEMKTYPEKIGRSIETYRFREALAEMMNLARLGNKYLTDTEPWKLIKTDEARTATVLNISLQICANLAILCEPFIPFSAEKLCHMLNLEKLPWAKAGEMLMQEGAQLEKPEIMFEKIEDDAIDAQLTRLANIKEQNALNAWKPAEPKATVAFEDFGKIDIRVATVLECTKVPKADKLLQFKLDDGTGTPRTILSGIAKYYPEPEKLVGMQVCFINNFAPKKLRGIDSNGMILSAEDRDGRLVLVTPSQKVSEGCNIG
ncbi:MAG: methionine--tRNA ligase [Bacteroidales bacterium]|nr:methionine--tRNA ligase [Bacteroidales bacterium]